MEFLNHFAATYFAILASIGTWHAIEETNRWLERRKHVALVAKKR